MSPIAIGGIALIIAVGNALCILADYKLAGPSAHRQPDLTVDAEREWRGESQQHTNQAEFDAESDVMAQYILERRGNRL